MYIVKIKNPERFSWKELPLTKCRFNSLDKAVALYKSILNSRSPYAGMDVMIWDTKSDHRVELNESAI